MSLLRGSLNYVWSTTSVLGKGATGAVYQGVNKTNGEPVAVKTFNHESHRRPLNVQMREFEVLKKVKHENIVKLLAIEEEQEGRDNVIVMELCTGGSLFSILDDPENTYGLCEEDFLLVLEHLTAGMKHLRDNNLVHRDLKPGNIMKFICDDGTTVYKLTDFGAARELQEGQQFFSLYGTEEYLHPDIYERAVLHKKEGKLFGATVDLWSIGVTLYHVATGNLPFRPYGGRRNTKTMFHITTKKASGCISGIQTEEDGAIEWGYELPRHCQLSAGLKKFVTPLLAGLLEADQKKIWSFDRFFNEVTDTLSRKALHIFHANRAALIRVYIHPDEKYEQLQNYITEQTKITLENQILIFKEKAFVDVVGDNTRAGGYPETTKEEPLTLFSKENNNVEIETEMELPSKFKEFQNLVSVENDAAQAKVACSLGHECKRRVERASLSCKLISDAVNSLSMYMTEELKKLHKNAQHLMELTKSRSETASVVFLLQKTVNSLLDSTSGNSQENFPEVLSEISDVFLKETKPRVEQLHEQNVAENKLKSEWESSSGMLKCPYKTRAPNKAATEVERLRDSWQQLVRDRVTRTLNYNDQQFHNLERIKITETIRRIKSLLENDTLKSFVQYADNLSDWYKIAQTVYLQTMILNKDLGTYELKLDKFNEQLVLDNMQFKDEMKGMMERAKNGTNGTQGQSNKFVSSQLKSFFKKVDLNKREIVDVIVTNSALIEKICCASEKLEKKLNGGTNEV